MECMSKMAGVAGDKSWMKAETAEKATAGLLTGTALAALYLGAAQFMKAQPGFVTSVLGGKQFFNVAGSLDAARIGLMAGAGVGGLGGLYLLLRPAKYGAQDGKEIAGFGAHATNIGKGVLKFGGMAAGVAAFAVIAQGLAIRFNVYPTVAQQVVMGLASATLPATAGLLFGSWTPANWEGKATSWLPGAHLVGLADKPAEVVKAPAVVLATDDVEVAE